MTGEKEPKGILDFTECNQFILWMRKLREREMAGVTQQPPARNSGRNSLSGLQQAAVPQVPCALRGGHYSKHFQSFLPTTHIQQQLDQVPGPQDPGAGLFSGHLTLKNMETLHLQVVKKMVNALLGEYSLIDCYQTIMHYSGPLLLQEGVNWHPIHSTSHRSNSQGLKTQMRKREYKSWSFFYLVFPHPKPPMQRTEERVSSL